MRAFLGLVAGLAAAIVAAMLISFVGGFFVDMPASVNVSDAAAIRESYSALGTGAQLLGIFAWAAGAFVGAYVAKRISGRAWTAWTVVGILVAYQLASVLLLPMPGWMQVLGLVLPLIAGFVASRLVGERTMSDESLSSEAGMDAEV